MDGLFQARPKGGDSWYAPDRDLLQVWPSCIVRGAAYACDRGGSIYSWLDKQDGYNSGNIQAKMRNMLGVCLKALTDCRRADLGEVLNLKDDEWPAFQALMFGAGIVGFKTFNVKFRESRMTTIATGAVSEPVPEVDLIRAMYLFDKMVTETADGK